VFDESRFIISASINERSGEKQLHVDPELLGDPSLGGLYRIFVLSRMRATRV
jgi:hypothetical protein